MIRTPALDFEQLTSLPQGARIVAYGPHGARYRGAIDSVETATVEHFDWTGARLKPPVPLRTTQAIAVTLVVSNLPMLPDPVPQKITLTDGAWSFYVDADAGALPSALVLGPEHVEPWHVSYDASGRLTHPVAHRKRALGRLEVSDLGFRVIAISVAIVFVGAIFAAAASGLGFLR